MNPVSRVRAKNTSKKDLEVIDFNRCAPEEDECRYIIKKVIEQAVRDFTALEHAETATEQYDFQTAVCFLFEDEYRVNWGGEEMSLQDLLDWVDLEASWVRKKAIETKARKLKKLSLKEKERQKNDKRKNSVPSGKHGVQRR